MNLFKRQQIRVLRYIMQQLGFPNLGVVRLSFFLSLAINTTHSKISEIA